MLSHALRQTFVVEAVAKAEGFEATSAEEIEAE